MRQWVLSVVPGDHPLDQRITVPITEYIRELRPERRLELISWLLADKQISVAEAVGLMRIP